MRTVRSATLTVGLLVSLLAAATIATVGAGATPAARHRAASLSLLLTNSSNGTTVVATPGELIVVQLTGGQLRWSEAQASGGTSTAEPVLVRLSGSVTSSGSSTTTFRVAHAGTAEIDATGTPVCSPATAAAGSACPEYIVLWHVTVDVPVVDPPAPAA
ncbi:MAG: hypothetical protein ACLQPH_11065 [Acidimicrobiales bacterium]